MILNNKWYPCSTNRRSIRYDNRSDPMAPFGERIRICFFGGVMPGIELINVFMNERPLPYLVAAFISVLTLPVYDALWPIKKCPGVPLDGERLVVLQAHLDIPLEEAAKSVSIHKVVDEYLANESVQDAAYEIARFKLGRRHSATIVELSMGVLHRAAEAAVWQMSHSESHRVTAP